MTDIVERMTDIVERLRFLYATHPVVMEAAADIERLQDDRKMLALCEGDRKEMADEIERLRAALEFYARPLNYDKSPTPLVMRDQGDTARRALEPKP